jgi:ABC-type branched-subunit amino acid transport system ATPase component
VMEHGRIVQSFEKAELEQNLPMLHEFLGV